MMPDMNGFPIGGSVLLSGVAYVGVMMFGLGPLVAERTIERDGWMQRCEYRVIKEIKASQPTLKHVPQFNCKGILGAFTNPYDPATQKICGFIDKFQDHSVIGQIGEQNRRLIDAYRNRVEHAARSAGSACSCAVSLMQSEERKAWAIYAGSLRLFELSEIENRHAKLRSALATPLCQGVGQ